MPYFTGPLSVDIRGAVKLAVSNDTCKELFGGGLGFSGATKQTAQRAYLNTRAMTYRFDSFGRL